VRIQAASFSATHTGLLQTGDGSADVTSSVPGPSPRSPLSWNIPGHRGHAHDERTTQTNDAQNALQNARTARTVAEHATDADDCRLLLDMLGLRLDALRADPPPAR
jgi:hypothetical protein